MNLPNECLSCLFPLVLKMNECEVCGAPAKKILNESDLVPLQFLSSFPNPIWLEELLSLSLQGHIQISFPLTTENQKTYEELKSFRVSLLMLYQSLAEGLPLAELGATAAVGISQQNTSSQSAQVLQNLRRLVFEPIQQHFEKTAASMERLETEWKELEPWLRLKTESRKTFDRHRKVQAMALMNNPAARSDWQSHLDAGVKNFEKKRSQVADEFSGLRALAENAFLGSFRSVAGVKLYLHSGEGSRDFWDLMDREKLRKGMAPATGFLVPPSNALYYETLLELVSWRSFRESGVDSKTRVREKLDLECIERTLGYQRGRSEILDFAQALLLLEKNEGLTQDQEGLLKKYAQKEKDWAWTQALLRRPFNSSEIEKLIDQNPELESLGWIVGRSLDFHQLPEFRRKVWGRSESGRLYPHFKTWIRKIEAGEGVQFSEDILKVFTEKAENWTSPAPWDSAEVSNEMKQAVFQILLNQTKDHRLLCQILKFTQSSPKVFWSRTVIHLDSQLLESLLTSKDVRYNVQHFFSGVSFVKQFNRLKNLFVSREFLEKSWDFFQKELPGNRSDFAQLIVLIQERESIYQSDGAEPLVTQLSAEISTQNWAPDALKKKAPAVTQAQQTPVVEKTTPVDAKAEVKKALQGLLQELETEYQAKFAEAAAEFQNKSKQLTAEFQKSVASLGGSADDNAKRMTAISDFQKNLAQLQAEYELKIEQLSDLRNRMKEQISKRAS